MPQQRLIRASDESLGTASHKQWVRLLQPRSITINNLKSVDADVGMLTRQKMSPRSLDGVFDGMVAIHSFIVSVTGFRKSFDRKQNAELSSTAVRALNESTNSSRDSLKPAPNAPISQARNVVGLTGIFIALLSAAIQEKAALGETIDLRKAEP